MSQKVGVVGVTANAAGVATATLTNYGPYTWDLAQISPSMPTAGSGAVGKIYKGGAFIADFVPSSDAVSGAPTLQLYAGESASAQWTGLTAGSTGQVTFIYDDGVPA